MDAGHAPEGARDLPGQADGSQLGTEHRRARHGPHLHVRQPQDEAGQGLERRPRRHQGHVRAPRHPRGRARVPRGRRCAVRLRDRVPQHARGGREAGRRLHHDRGRAPRPQVGARRARVLWHAHPAHRPQVRGAALRRVVRRLVRVRSQGRAPGLPAPELLPPQRPGRRPVRAHAHHRRARAPTCTSSRAAPRPSTTRPTSTPARWSSS